MTFWDSTLRFFGIRRNYDSQTGGNYSRRSESWVHDPRIRAALGLDGSLSGVSVNRRTVLSIPAVWGAIDTISKTLASLPFDLYERTEDGAVPATRHKNYYLTKFEPAEYMSGYNFRRALFAQACLKDAYARIYRDGVGRPVKFVNLDSDDVQPFFTSDGSLMYRVDYRIPEGVSGNVTFRQEILFPWEVLHIKGLTLNGLVGEDVIQRHRETFGVSLAATQYGSAFFGNGAHISGIIEVPGQLELGMVEKLRKQFKDKYAGVDKTGNTAVLDGGMKYSKIGLTPQEATLNDTRTFQRREVATIFGIPLHLLQDLGDTTFNNVETMSTQFVTLCLRPWAVQFEQEMAIKTLTATEKQTGRYFYRLNLNGLLRGDTAARTALYKSGIESGWLLRNDARELEDLNRLPGLDKPLYPANMNMLDENGEVEQITNQNADQMAQSQTDNPDTGNQDSNGTPQAGK